MRVWAVGATLLTVLSIGACSDSDGASEAKAPRSSAKVTTAIDATTDESTTSTDATSVAADGSTVAAKGSTMTTTAKAKASGASATTTSTATTGASSTTASSATGSDTTATTSASTTTTAVPFQSQTSLRIQGRRFDPSDLVIGQRTRVTVTNGDAEAHTWTSDSGEWNSGRIVAGGSFTHSFTRVGTFAYHCEIHPSMTGSVTVN
ncbi:MAG TPA: cupredoxin domain-containing protein [Acidimicrobiales bacterium]|nr:cupredoxin domain-containing protein [Acidimicrobiales bacterium]